MATLPYRCLTRHFARGFIENDLLAPDEGMQATLAPLLAAIAAPGLILPTVWLVSYGWPFATADEFRALVIRHELILIVFPMLIVGLVATLQWDSLYPDARDRAVLGPLPVSTATLFCAKASALFLFVGLFALAANGLLSVSYPLVANVRPQPGSPGLGGTFLAHVVSTFGAALFAGLAVVAVPGALQVILPPRGFRAAAAVLQLASVFVLVLSFLFVPFLLSALDPGQQGKLAELVSLHRLYRVDGEGTIDWLHPPSGSSYERDTRIGGMRPRPGAGAVERHREVQAFPNRPLTNVVTGAARAGEVSRSWVYWCPPLWFLGWYEELAGRGTDMARLLAGRARSGLALAGAAALGFYVIAYGRHARGGASGGPAAGRLRPRSGVRLATARLLRVAMASPVSRASFAFSIKTLVRSARHRLVVAGSLGVGLALSLAYLSSALIGGNSSNVTTISLASALSVQPVLIGCVLIGTRIAFTVPSSLPANWVFRFHGPELVDELAAGARGVAMVFGILLPLALLAPLHLLLLGWRMAGLHLVLGLLFGLVLLETVQATFVGIPFAAAYVPGKARLRTRFLPYVAAFQAYVASVVGIETWAMAGTNRVAAAAGGVLLVYFCVAAWRHRRQRGACVVYDEPSPDAIQTLGIDGPLFLTKDEPV
jgi:hypothetical protein